MSLLERKVYTVELKTSELPEDKKAVYALLENERFLGIKGGFAKAVLQSILERQGKIPKKETGSKTETDLDLVLTFAGGRRKNIDLLDKRISGLIEKLRDKVALNPADIETIKGNLNDPETVQKFLESRDLTINEVVLVPCGDNKWKLHYTDKCYRDTMNRIGVLSTNGTGTMRIEAGRMIASPYGITRLLRFLIEEKVEGIYLPKWWIVANNTEAKRLKKENLGVYGLVLCQRYQQLGRPDLKKRMMRLLKALGFTDLESFELYAQEQKTFFQLWTGEKFEFDPNRSFREIQEHLLEKEEAGKNSHKEQKTARESCTHRYKLLWCNDCDKQCTIAKCTKCSRFEITQNNFPVLPNDLLCNRNLMKANISHDRDGFFYL